jgi:hypothetical protein
MATKPTRGQQQACDQFAEALVLITEGARLDGRGTFDAADLSEVARRVAGASSAFSLDAILARALGRRARALGLPSDTADLLTLMEADVTPLGMLRLDDDGFKQGQRTQTISHYEQSICG